MSSKISLVDAPAEAQNGAKLSHWNFISELAQPDAVVCHEEEAQIQRRRILRSGSIGLLLYGLFFFADPVMVPDVYHQAWAIRALVAVLFVLGILGSAQMQSRFAREGLAALSIVMAAASVAWIAALSTHPNAVYYPAGIVLIVMFSNIALGLYFVCAAFISGMLLAIYALCMVHMKFLAIDIRVSSWLFFLASVVISLIANFQMERDRRRAFMAHEREQERNAELSEAVELLKKMSLEDSLTRIANRRELDLRLQYEWARARRDQQPVALILVDVDSFKAYNDHYGHPAGDTCLKKIANVLQAVPQRATDLVARFGGEEFVVLLPATTLDDGAELAERMRQAVLDLNMPHAASHTAPIVSASFGVAAAVPLADSDASQLLNAADAALYRAKANGRNQVTVQIR